MRIALPTAYAIGLILKLLHLPYNAIFIMVVLGAGLVWIIRGLVHGKTGRPGWSALAIWAWGVHLLAVLKLYPIQLATLVLAGLLTVIATIHVLRGEGQRSRELSMLAGMSILILLLMAQPVSKRYYTTNLLFSLERDTDHRSWDKYSYFLLREGLTEDALVANERAIDAAMEQNDPETKRLLEERRDRILQGDWGRYGPLREQ